MPIGTETIISVLCIGSDATLAAVRMGPAGVSARKLGTLGGFADRPVEGLRRELGAIPSAGRLVLVAPPRSVAVRPIGLSVTHWRAAREEVMHSLGKLFPMTAEEACVGLIEREAPPGPADADPHAGSGYLVAARRDAIDPLAERAAQLIGRAVDEIIPHHAALLGLGLQHHSRVGLVDETPAGEVIIHRLHDGEIAELAAPWSGEVTDAAALSGLELLRLPTVGRARGERDGALRALRRISAEELAIGAAIAGRLRPRRYAPLRGRTARSAPRWAAPVAAVLAAVLVLALTPAIENARYARALDELAAETSAIEADLERARAARAETARVRELVERELRPAVAGWTPVTGDLAAALGVLPDDAYVYEVRLTPGSLRLRGEAPTTGELLRAIEDAPEFVGAARENPSSAVPMRDAETFDFSARRRTGRADAPPETAR